MEATTKRGYTYSLAQQYQNAIADYQAELKVNPQDNDTFQRMQYAQSMLAAKNASPSPTPPIASPTPEEKRLMDKISPLYIGIGVVALLIIAVIVRLLTRGKASRAAIEFVNASSQNFFDTTVREVSLRTLFAGRGDPMVVQMQV
jgi:hypothetical protein